MNCLLHRVSLNDKNEGIWVRHMSSTHVEFYMSSTADLKGVQCNSHLGCLTAVRLSSPEAPHPFLSSFPPTT